MARGPLYQNDYKPQLSGHETFPMRYGWLKKAYDQVAATEHNEDNRLACWGDEAIAQFGVGKNMVGAIRFWANSAGIIAEKNESPNSVATTDLGRLIFGKKGLDPFMEHSATLWLCHWNLAANQEKTTWYWAFGYYPSPFFERADMLKRLERLAEDLNWARASHTTLKNDIGVFVRTYAPKQAGGRLMQDSALECPLTELGLLKAVGKKDGFRFVRGPKSTLGIGVFTYALLEFWDAYSPSSATLSFEAIAHEPGSPGRVFLLDENDVADRLAELDQFTNNTLRWSETAGLKQVIRTEASKPLIGLDLIQHDFVRLEDREVA